MGNFFMFDCGFEINTIRNIKVTFFGIVIKYVIKTAPVPGTQKKNGRSAAFNS